MMQVGSVSQGSQGKSRHKREGPRGIMGGSREALVGEPPMLYPDTSYQRTYIYIYAFDEKTTQLMKKKMGLPWGDFFILGSIL